MRLPNKGKQCLISMLYEIEHTKDYIELLMNAGNSLRILILPHNFPVSQSPRHFT